VLRIPILTYLPAFKAACMFSVRMKYPHSHVVVFVC